MNNLPINLSLPISSKHSLAAEKHPFPNPTASARIFRVPHLVHHMTIFAIINSIPIKGGFMYNDIEIERNTIGIVHQQWFTIQYKIGFTVMNHPPTPSLMLESLALIIRFMRDKPTK